MTAKGRTSVIITTYYRNRRLRDAIESVLQQSYEPIDVVVVDGSGEAHAEPVVADYPVEYIPQQADQGFQVAREVGLSETEGRYVQFLDDDDRLRPEKIAKQVRLISNHTRVVYCGEQIEQGRINLPDPSVKGSFLEHALRLEAGPFVPSTMLLRRDVLAPIRPLGNHHGGDDMAMKIELARRTECDFVNEPLVLRGRDPDGHRTSWEHVEATRALLDRYESLYAEYPDAYRRAAFLTNKRTAGRYDVYGLWSLQDIRARWRMARLADDGKLTRYGGFIASLFGKYGIRVASALIQSS